MGGDNVSEINDKINAGCDYVRQSTGLDIGADEISEIINLALSKSPTRALYNAEVMSDIVSSAFYAGVATGMDQK